MTTKAPRILHNSFKVYSVDPIQANWQKLEKVDYGESVLSVIEYISFCRICLSSNVQMAPSLLAPFFGFRLLDWEPLEIRAGEFRDLAPGVSYFPARTIYCQVCSGVSLGMNVDEGSLVGYYTDYQGDEFLESRYRLEPSFQNRMSERNNPNVLRKRGESIDYLDRIDSYLLENIDGPVPDEVLDIGGGTGSNSPLKSTAKIDVIDISPQWVRPPKDSYPLVSLMNVLEHVMNPLETLNLAVSYLDRQRPSYVLIEVPLEKFMSGYSQDIDTSTELKIRDFWQGKKIWTEHVNSFTPRTLTLLAKSAGLELVAPLAQFQTDLASPDDREGKQNTAIVGLFRASRLD
jgi:hypothetical protein